MSYKIRFNAEVVDCVEVSDESECLRLLALFGVRPIHPSALRQGNALTPELEPPRPPDKERLEQRATRPPLGDGLAAFLDRLKTPNHQRLIQVLTEADIALTDAQLRTAMGLRDNQQLSGILSSLRKQVEAVGLDFSDAVRKHRGLNERGEELHTYEVTPELKQLARSS